MEQVAKVIKKVKTLVLSKKRVTNNEFIRALSLLKTIENDTSKRDVYCNLMGKILLKKENYSLAKGYFLKELDINKSSFSAYYNLYKISVVEKKYKEAYSYLKRYKELNEGNDVGVELQLSMLSAVLDIDEDLEKFLEKDYNVLLCDYFVSVKIKDDLLKKIYHQVIDAFNRKDLKSMKLKIDEFSKLVDTLNVPIEVMTVRYIFEGLLESLVRKVSEKNNIADIKELFNYIDKLIDVDIKKASFLLENINLFMDVSKYGIEVKFLENRINERKYYLLLSEEQKEAYELFVREGRKAFKSEKYCDAFDYYMAGSYVTNHPVFDYYIGKTYFKMKFFDIAYLYFCQYEKKGGEKLVKSLLYLWSMDDRNNRFEQIKEDANKIDSLVFMFDRFGDWKKFDYTRRLNFDFNAKNFDWVKQKRSSYIVITEDDFSFKTLALEDYYSYELEDKISVIINLYCKGDLRIADRLLKELEKGDNEPFENNKIAKLRRNRVLYLNKAKRNY